MIYDKTTYNYPKLGENRISGEFPNKENSQNQNFKKGLFNFPLNLLEWDQPFYWIQFESSQQKSMVNNLIIQFKTRMNWNVDENSNLDTINGVLFKLQPLEADGKNDLEIWRLGRLSPGEPDCKNVQ